MSVQTGIHQLPQSETGFIYLFCLRAIQYPYFCLLVYRSPSAALICYLVFFCLVRGFTFLMFQFQGSNLHVLLFDFQKLVPATYHPTHNRTAPPANQGDNLLQILDHPLGYLQWSYFLIFGASKDILDFFLST